MPILGLPVSNLFQNSLSRQSLVVPR
jgi:hypothetical protein